MAERGSLVEANFHCKGFACSCRTPHYSCALTLQVLHQAELLLWYPLVSGRAYTNISSLGTLTYAFSRPMNMKCMSCYRSLYLSCSCLSAQISLVVDLPFINPAKPFCSYAHNVLRRFLFTISYTYSCHAARLICHSLLFPGSTWNGLAGELSRVQVWNSLNVPQ